MAEQVAAAHEVPKVTSTGVSVDLKRGQVLAIAFRQSTATSCREEAIVFTREGAFRMHGLENLSGPIHIGPVLVRNAAALLSWSEITCAASDGANIFLGTSSGVWRLDTSDNVQLLAGRAVASPPSAAAAQPPPGQSAASAATVAGPATEAAGEQPAPTTSRTLLAAAEPGAANHQQSQHGDAATAASSPPDDFTCISSLTCGRRGVLYVMDKQGVHSVCVPPPPPSPVTMAAPAAGGGTAAPANPVAGAAAAAVVTPLVLTIAQRLEPKQCDGRLAFDHSKGVLYVADYSKVLKVEVEGGAVVAQATELVTTDLAYRSNRGRGLASSKFSVIGGIAVMGDSLLIIDAINDRYGDMAPPNSVCALSLANGEAVTGHTDVPVQHTELTVLPYGVIALYSPADGSSNSIQLLRCPSATPWRAPSTYLLRMLDGSSRLAARVGALMAAGGTSGSSTSSSVLHDVTIRVGDRSFPAHSLILAGRSSFFGSLGATTTSSSRIALQELVLEGADPAAFEKLLGYIYSGVLEHTTPELLKPMAELADRLLLKEASTHLQQELVAATTPATLVNDMLWARKHGLTDLVGDLKNRYQEFKLEVDEDSLERLLAADSDLFKGLHTDTAKRARLR